MTLRICNRCGLEAHTKEELELFAICKTAKHGRRNTCKACTSARYHKEGGDPGYWAKTKIRIEGRDRTKQAEWNRLNNPRHMRFKDKILLPRENPRKNICSICGRRYPEELKRQTTMHHDEYDEDNPTADTREMCNSCHSKWHYERGDYPIDGAPNPPVF